MLYAKILDEMFDILLNSVLKLQFFFFFFECTKMNFFNTPDGPCEGALSWIWKKELYYMTENIEIK